MLKLCLALIVSISLCGCTTLQQSAPAGASSEQTSGQANFEQAAELDAAATQNAVQPRSSRWALLGIAAAVLFLVLLSMAGGAGGLGATG